MINNQTLTNETNELSQMQITPGTVFWFDVDLVELSLLNRKYGRQTGDEFLECMEKYINNIREVKTCVHIESGRFIFDVVMPSTYTNKDIATYWREIIFDFVKNQQEKYPDFSIRISCGICPVESGDKVWECIENATLARKESRRNRSNIPVVFSESLLDDLNILHSKEVEIRKALMEDRFLYYLQPIVDLNTGKIIAAEALARCKAVDGTIKFPDSFLPIMENNGSVVDLDYLILRKVCQSMRKRIDNKKPVVCTSINLSRVHLDDENTADTLLSIANEYNIPAKLLNFELTETLPMDEYSKAKTLIDKLRKNGFSVSIDDYGSGYTGITIWQSLDFDVLKMDRNFLSDDEAIKMRNTVLIPNTLDLAKQMDISVICEGVERQEQCACLLEWGCNIAQGYFFSRPISEEDFYKKYEQTNGAFPISFKKQ